MADAKALSGSVAREPPRQASTLHHLACTGGTIVSKALAAMRDVYLVSEVHPYRTAPFQFEPQASLAQFQAQYGALTPARLEKGFLAQVDVLADQAREDGRTLVLRDHSHSDFTTQDEGGAPVLLPLLTRAGWDVASAATIRDPVESYLSLRANGWTSGLDFDAYCARWLQFVGAYRHLPIFPYEQFTEEPDETLRELCLVLRIPFDPSYPSRIGLRSLTGDSGRSESAIAPRPFKPADTLLMAEAARSPAYAQILEAWPAYRRPLGGSAPRLRTGAKVAPDTVGVRPPGPQGIRNMLINGDFSIWQRGESVRIEGWSWRYIADRWRVYLDGASAHCLASMEEETGPMGAGAPPSPRFVRLAFHAAADTGRRQIYQAIEPIHMFSGSRISISAWIRSAAKGGVTAGASREFDLAGAASQLLGFNAQSPLSPGWKRHSWTIAVPEMTQPGPFGPDARIEVALAFTSGAQSVIDVACVQVESGDEPTPFEGRPLAFEFAMCRRYYRKSLSLLDANDLKYEMRIAPALSGSDPYLYDAEFEVMRATPEGPSPSHDVNSGPSDAAGYGPAASQAPAFP